MQALPIDTGERYLPLVQVVQLTYIGALPQNHLIFRKFLLLQEIQQLSDRRTPKEYILQMILKLQVGIPQQLILEPLRQPRLHLLLNHHIPRILLYILMLQVIPYFVLQGGSNLQIVHVGGVEDQIVFEVVVDGPGPQNNLDDVVDHVSVHDKPEAEAEECVDGLHGVIRSDITITDRCDGVDTPVKSVEILDTPSIVQNGGVGSGGVQPAYCIGQWLRELFQRQTRSLVRAQSMAQKKSPTVWESIKIVINCLLMTQQTFNVFLVDIFLTYSSSISSILMNLVTTITRTMLMQMSELSKAVTMMTMSSRSGKKTDLRQLLTTRDLSVMITPLKIYPVLNCTYMSTEKTTIQQTLRAIVKGLL